MKNRIILMLIMILVMSALFTSAALASTDSFLISGTVFYDQNGNGWRDVDETKYISSARSCKGGVIVSGAKIKVVAEKGKNSKTNYYSLDYCGVRTGGKYAGLGVYYDTKSYEVGTKLTIELIAPSGWKSTWPNPVVLEVDSEHYVDFAMAEEVPIKQQQIENADEKQNLIANNQNANVTVQNIQQNVTVANQKSEIQQQIKIIDQERNISKEEVARAIVKIEKRNKTKTFLFGSDYKSLGDLRSEMVKTKNQIEQLKRLTNKADSDQDKVGLQNQIQSLEQEQIKIGTFITQNENQFSLLGWVVKLFQ